MDLINSVPLLSVLSCCLSVSLCVKEMQYIIFIIIIITLLRWEYIPVLNGQTQGWGEKPSIVLRDNSHSWCLHSVFHMKTDRGSFLRNEESDLPIFDMWPNFHLGSCVRCGRRGLLALLQSMASTSFEAYAFSLYTYKC